MLKFKSLRRNYIKSLLLVREFNALTHTVRRRIYIALLVLSIIALLGIGTRIVSSIKLRHITEQEAILNVATINAIHGPKIEEIVLPGDVQAWHEAVIFARTNGYIKDWYTDIGAHVKTGDLLAQIETPELDAQLMQAEADLKTAEANNQLAQTTMERWKILFKTESVSKQDLDEKNNSALANTTMVESARANRDRLRDLVNFERVIAPFDGVITLRNIDIGSLINQGSGTAPSLFQISQVDRLRIYVKVPQNYSSRLSPDMEVKLYFTEHPGKTFSAKLFNTAQAVDPTTRTLLAEFTADNKNYELLAGSYAQVHLMLPLPDYIVRLPVNTLLFRAHGLQVGIIDDKNRVMLKSIVTGRDFGNEIEVVSGIKPGEAIIINPPDSLMPGQKVNVVASPETTKEVTKS